MEIEAIRFEDKLEVSIDVVSAMLATPVPLFVLLPLVEKAIKHGFGRAARPLKVHIRAEGGSGESLDAFGTPLDLTSSQVVGRLRPPSSPGILQVVFAFRRLQIS